MKPRRLTQGRGVAVRGKLGKMMKCIFIGKQVKVDELVDSSESLATKDYSAAGYSSGTAAGAETKTNASNIEEAETSLREGGYLNYEEARALLGRLEYQKGNMEAAFRVFEGIDVASVIPNMKVALTRRSEMYKKWLSPDGAAPLPMSMHAVSLLLEAIYLKSKSLEALGRLEEAAISCQVILDTVESAIPDGLPEKFAKHCKLQDSLSKAVELLPELWKISGYPNEAVLSYRRALLYDWTLEDETRSRIEKEFAVFLLYSGNDAVAPTLRVQMDGSFIPRNNIEEAVLLLLISLRKVAQKRTKWDPSILDHLCFALSVCGDLKSLADQVEQLSPEIMNRKERSRVLALCHYADGNESVALNLLKNLRSDRENNDNSTLELLLLSKICGESSDSSEEGTCSAKDAISALNAEGCGELRSRAYSFLGISLSTQSRRVVSQSRRVLLQSDALQAFETARNLGMAKHPDVAYHLAVENAEQRKLDVAMYYAKELLRLEAGSSLRGWILLARILSAQKRNDDAQVIVNAALEQTGKWNQSDLLRTKAKLQIAQGQTKSAIQTYTQLLAVLQVRNKSYFTSEQASKSRKERDKYLEAETWHDLANVYTRLSQWRDAEVCLSKSEALHQHSASRWHAKGLLCQAKGLHDEALQSFWKSLDLDPAHVPSLVSMGKALMEIGNHSTVPVARSFLREAIRLDRSNVSAWYNLGIICKLELGGGLMTEAVECFEAASLLDETNPVEPFR